MRIFRIFIFVFLFCALVTNASAFDTAGKFGMGVRFWGTPIITFSNIKFGVNNQFGLEPSLGYHSWTSSSNGSESTNNIMLFSVVADFNAIKAARSNFLLRFGGIYSKAKSSYSYDGFDSSSTTTGWGVLWGIGIEHFVNENFAINVGALSGYWNSSPDDSDASTSLMSFSSQLVDFSLVWYLR